MVAKMRPTCGKRGGRGGGEPHEDSKPQNWWEESGRDMKAPSAARDDRLQIYHRPPSTLNALALRQHHGKQEEEHSSKERG